MRLLPLAPVLAALVVLSGCVEFGAIHTYKKTAYAGACEFCADGECVPCSEAECDECLESHGDCAAMERQAAPEAEAARPAPPPDFNVQVTHSLAGGFPETTWGFDVAGGATGHVRIAASDPALNQASLAATVCFEYDVTGPGSRQSGTNGHCGVGGSTSPEPYVLADWDFLRPGHYVLTLSAPPQANELSIDILVDNP